MKFLAILLLHLFCCSELLCQENINADSLSKYSYQLLGFKNKSPAATFGTCFFVNVGGQLYAITARHILYSCDSNLNVAKAIEDYVLIYTGSKFININLPQYDNNCSKIDLIAIKIDNSWNALIHSVDSFMIPPINNNGQVHIFGQGLENSPNHLALTKPHHLSLKKGEYMVELSVTDSTYYLFLTNKIRVDNTLKGYSGSPVFIQDYKTNKWRLCGSFVRGGYVVLIYNDDNYFDLDVVKQQFIYEAIERHL